MSDDRNSDPDDTQNAAGNDDSTTNAESSSFVRNATDATFEVEVFHRSHEAPVIVDFWATWCEPCKLLTPVLEHLAEECAGKFVLVKAETSQAANAAAHFNVSSVPALFAVVDGEVVDATVGGMPEPQLREWIMRIVDVSTYAEAVRIEETSPTGAEAAYRSLLKNNPEHAEAKIGLARVRLAQDDAAEAQELITSLEERGFLEPEAETVKSALQFAIQGAVDIAPLQAAVDKNPEDNDALLALAQGLAATKDFRPALDHCLTLVTRDRRDTGETARRLMIDVLRVLTDDEMVSEYRRKLSMSLY